MVIGWVWLEFGRRNIWRREHRFKDYLYYRGLGRIVSPVFTQENMQNV